MFQIFSIHLRSIVSVCESKKNNRIKRDLYFINFLNTVEPVSKVDTSYFISMLQMINKR